jgi:hypothetical protein
MQTHHHHDLAWPRLLAGIVLLALSSVAIADSYLEELILQSREQSLAEQDYWHRLVYYKRNGLTGSIRSETADPGFFMARQGRYDPQAELEATLAAFFRTDEEPITGQPYQCRFPARFQWLQERLEFDPERLPLHDCEKFQAWYQGIDPGQATLVFASDYVNNPSSMFGHTLLRLDPPGQGEDSRLLSYAINYAADTTESNGLVFAVKGLTGGYDGRFSVMPYYEKVKEYNDWENRDLWEYQLSLEPHEIQRLMMHAWELGPVSFDYYFLHENCSFRLLGLLEVARPGLALTDRFGLWAIPTDTVRVALADDGMLTDVVYRPAASTVLQHQIGACSSTVQDIAHALAHSRATLDDPRLSELPKPERARALELAYSHLYYLFLGRDVAAEEAKPQMRRLLVARSQIPLSQERAQPPAPETRPDQGHATARIALIGGQLEHNDFVELRLRPAYHDLLDPAPGYKNGAQINFLDLAFRHWTETGNTQFEALTFIDIFSLAPRDRFFRTTSWNASVGIERQVVRDEGRPLVLALGGGGGYTLSLGDSALLYTSIQTRLQGGDRLPDKVRVGAGPQAGVLFDLGSLRTMLSAEMLWYSDAGNPQWAGRLESRLGLGRDFSLGLLLERREDYGIELDQVALSLRWYL